MGDDGTGSAWRSPVVVAAFVTGVLGLVGVLVPRWLSDDDDEGDRPHVIEVTVGARERSFSARCPFTVAFDGRITVDRGTGEIAYRWVYRDALDKPEVRDPVRTVRVDGAGTTPLRYEWTANVPHGPVFRTVSLEVVAPVTTRSDAVTVQGVCDATLPPAPPVPPPDVPGGPPA